MPQASGVADLLQALAPVLPTWCDGWYVSGAQAVQAWGLPRLSADVDVTIRVRSQELGPFLDVLEKALGRSDLMSLYEEQRKASGREGR